VGHFYTETASSTFPLLNPCSCCVMCPVLISEGSQQIYFLRGEVFSLTPNHQPGGPGYPFLSGSSPLTCLAREAIPIASLLPEQLSGLYDHASPTTTLKLGYLRWGATLTKTFKLFKILKNKKLRFRSVFRWNRSPEGTNGKRLYKCCLH
jgi:hypothetical protein